jgi:hypothetical protein
MSGTSAVPARVTPAQARAMGLTVKAKRQKNRSEARGAYHTRCCTEGCGATFDSAPQEDKHLAFHPDHTRYEVVLGLAP